MSTFIEQIKADSKNIFRDPMISIIPFVPVLAAFALSYLIPYINTLFAIKEYYHIFTVFIIILSPMVYSMVIGFMLLEDRDEQLLSYISITPSGKGGYLSRKMFIPVVASFLITLISVPVSRLSPVHGFFLVFPALVSASGVPLFALFLAGFANNKVEGLAYAKGSGVLFLSILFAFFLPEPIQYIAGFIFPYYWVARVFETVRMTEVNYLRIVIETAVGLSVNILWTYLFLRKFIKKCG